MAFSKVRRSSKEFDGGRQYPLTERPVRTRAVCTYLQNGSMSTLDKSSTFMLDTWFPDMKPWRARVTCSNKGLKSPVKHSSSPPTRPTVLIFGWPLLSMPVLMHLARVTPLAVFLVFISSHIFFPSSVFNKSTMKLLCLDKSGRSPVQRGSNTASISIFSSFMKYSLQPQPA